MAKTSARRKKKRTEPQRDDVTPERAALNTFASVGMARKLVPVIKTLLDAHQITQAEYDSLNYYRDQASLADRSPMRSCCDFSPRGGHGPGVAIISAQIETGRIERDLGQLVDIARAVAVDDKSLTQWCIEQMGGREKTSGGKVVAMVPRGKNNGEDAIAYARMELRMAAHRIAR